MENKDRENVAEDHSGEDHGDSGKHKQAARAQRRERPEVVLRGSSRQ
jgi:hypothetical protein